MIESLIARVRDAAAHQIPLVIRGGGSKDFYGGQAQGEELSTAQLSGIISYEPTELVLHARSGTRLAEIDALLADAHQMLAFEPPHFGPQATLGGCVAAGLSGPARASAGPLRDFVLGATLLDGRGEVLRFGGQVMKNVAGYDVSRLLAGSMGTLGVLLDLSLKVLPQPALTLTRRFEADLGSALARLSSWRSQPLPINASAWHDNQLLVRLSGSEAGVGAAARVLGGEPLKTDAATQWWHDVREQRHAFFSNPLPLWRVALPAGQPALGLGEGLIEWHGMQRWLLSDQPAALLRARAQALGGHATLFRASAEQRARDGVFTLPEAGVLAIHERLKQRFDPARIFNRARLYPQL